MEQSMHENYSNKSTATSTARHSKPLRKLEELGQSIWIDFIRRGMISSGELRRLIDEDGVSGVTSNPSIFEKAIAESHDYDSAIRSMLLAGKSVEEIYQTLTVEDIQSVADLLRPTYDRLQGADGFVSLEVSPKLAHDTSGTIAEARHLWSEVNRPNAFIKVPGTKEGVPTIRQLINEGININVTLLFGLPRYREVVDAYLAGLEERLARNLPLKNIASVASFFLSRIDVMIDPMLENKMPADSTNVTITEKLEGQTAIACAKIAYQIYKEIFSSDRFLKLETAGARTQRLLWASTSTKNPAYSDVKYVEPLIGPDTINTLPAETVNAYRDHGNPRAILTDGIAEAQLHLEHLQRKGIDLNKITERLEDEGVQKFITAYDTLMKTLKEKSEH